jgi:hypothetical protein
MTLKILNFEEFTLSYLLASESPAFILCLVFFNYRNKPNRMSDAEIMVILILFHSGSSSIIIRSMFANI